MRNERTISIPGTILLVLLVGSTRSACAHRMKVFAYAEGETVVAEAFFSASQKAVGVAVRVLAPDGDVLTEGVTDGAGEFRFKAAYRCAHRIVARTQDGHRAEYDLPGPELPSALPAYPGPDPAAEDPAQPNPSPAEQAARPALERMVEEAVARQVGPLRKQIEHYESRARVHDVVGGIGYIVGICGLAFFLTGRRRGNVNSHDVHDGR